MVSRWDAEHKDLREDNVSHLSPVLLFESTTLAEKVTLRDIFLLIDEHPLIQKILGNWADEYVKEGLSGGKASTNLVSLELRWNFSYTKDDLIAVLSHGLHFPELHGLDGSGSRYALDYCNASELASLPVKLNHTITFTNETEPKDPERLSGATFTLGDILYGIIWSLSFHGPPKTRDIKAKELEDRIRKAQSGESALISWEEVRTRLIKDCT